MRFDLLIKGGQTIDDAAGLSGRHDVAVHKGRIAAVEANIPASAAFRTIDATGLTVTPGLIDLHTHIYRGVTFWGIDADAEGSRSGVTSWIDAGSAGALNLEGFREFIMAPAKVRISAYLNISYIGLTAPDYELTNLAYCDVKLFEIVANQNRDMLHGVKVRLGASTVGGNGIAPLEIGLDAAERTGMPLMVHISVPPPGIGDILPRLRPGDVVTHCFTGHGMKLVDDAGVPHAVAREAIDRGIVLDIGHGAGSFSFKSAEQALAAGIKPHVISSDIHQISMDGPMFDLPTCLSKFLALGLPLGEVVAMATTGPAAALGMTDRGTLKPGSLADLALFSLHEGSFPLYDIAGEIRTGRQLLVNEMTIVGGRPLARQPKPPRAEWFEPWGTAGRDDKMIEFQKDLVRRGHVPEAMAGPRRFHDCSHHSHARKQGKHA
jgi:dihydroorotase